MRICWPEKYCYYFHAFTQVVGSSPFSDFPTGLNWIVSKLIRIIFFFDFIVFSVSENPRNNQNLTSDEIRFATFYEVENVSGDSRFARIADIFDISSRLRG